MATGEDMGPALPPEAQDGDASDPSAESSLFWGGDQPVDYENHPDFIAMQAAMDEFTPFEEAEAWKKQGNDKVKLARKAAYPHMKKRYNRDAVEMYTRAITKGRLDPETPQAFLSTCFNNRAQINLTLTNFRSALSDAEEAIKLDDTNKKAYFRGVKAALELRNVDKATELGHRGLAHARGDREYAALMGEVEEVAKAVALEEKRAEERTETDLGTAARFALLLRERGVTLGYPSFPDIQNKPYLDEDAVMHWPVIMVYPESGQVEFIEDFSETSTFAPMLEMMFQEDRSQLPWDEREEYTRDRITLYYSTSSAEAMAEADLVRWLDGSQVGAQARTWRRETFREIDAGRETLREILARGDCVMPGLPTIYALADNDFHKSKFHNGEW